MHEIELTPPQSRFMLCEAKYPLFLAGYGAGKSMTMAASIINDLQFPGANIGAYAPTYDLLRLITCPYIEEFLVEADIPYKLNKSTNIIQVEGHGNIIMRSMDNPARIVGYQTFRAHIDEIDTLREDQAEDAWNKIIARNRQKINRFDDDGRKIMLYNEDGTPKCDELGRHQAFVELNRVSAYTTPEGFKFAYRRWEKEPAEGYEIIRARTASNPHLPPDYIDSLRASYPENLIDAYLEGKFVNLEGKNVYKNFSRQDFDQNVPAEDCGNGVNTTIDGHEPLYVGMDFNVVHGAAVIHVLRDGLPHAVDEIHEAFDTDEQVAILKQRYPRNPINVYPDATGDRRTSANTVESDLAKLRHAGFNVVCDYSNPPIKDRVNSYNAMIYNAKHERRYFVNVDACPNLVNALEQQIWGDNGLPDKKAGLDHITDAGGYFINQMFPIINNKSETAFTRGRY